MVAWLDEVIHALEPDLRIMAKPVVLNNLTRAGLNPETVTRNQFAAVLPKIESGVRIFAPGARVDEIMRRVRQIVN